MNISGSFRKVDKVGCSQTGKVSIDNIEEIVGRDIIRRLDPLSFESSLESSGNVQMRGI